MVECRLDYVVRGWSLGVLEGMGGFGGSGGGFLSMDWSAFGFCRNEFNWIGLHRVYQTL